jgi:hypothetical protein
MAYVSYPGCRHGHVTKSPRKGGHADSGSTDRRGIRLHPSPLSGVGWGASDLGLTPAVEKLPKQLPLTLKAPDRMAVRKVPGLRRATLF